MSEEDHEIVDKVSDLLYKGIGNLDYMKSDYDMSKDQPKHTAWVTFDAGLYRMATDVQTTLEYANASEMQREIIKLVERVFTPELLEYVRSGDIVNLTLRIGPDTFAGYNLNEENGIEPNEELVRKHGLGGSTGQDVSGSSLVDIPLKSIDFGNKESS